MRFLHSIIIVWLCSIIAYGQEIKVKPVEVVTNDIEARTHPRYDGNGDACALLKVVIPALKDLNFTGWVTGVEYTPGEYKVYVPKGTKKVKFSHEKYAPGEIVFPEPAQEKTVYKVILELPTTKTIHVTDANAKMEEARKLFESRKYKDAKLAYDGASYAKDITSEQKSLCLNAMSLCDSCSYYTRIVNGAYKEMKSQQSIDQQSAANCADIAIQAMRHLNVLNPSTFYETKINELKSFVNTMPLSLRFTIVKWVKTVAGVEEGGAMPNVELWGKYSDGSIVKLGTSDDSGVVDIELDRNKLPSSIEFRPVGYSKKTKSADYNMDDLMSRASNEHSKSQVRIQIFTTE